MKKNNTHTFLKISDKLFNDNQTCEFSLFTNVSEGLNKLISKENEVYEKKKIINDLYIKFSDKEKLNNYIENNIDTLIKNSSLPIEDKLSIIKEIASIHINKLFENDINLDSIQKVDYLISSLTDIIKNSKGAAKSLLKLIAYDYETSTHCFDVATYAICFGKFLNLNDKELDLLGKAAVFHDIGKKYVPHEILTKDTLLTPNEFHTIKSHVIHSVNYLNHSHLKDKELIEIIGQHHEKCNGNGYPRGLKENEIHPLAKILTICDVFSAITQKRVYKDRRETLEAIKIMKNEMKGHFCSNRLIEFIKFMKVS